MAIKLHYFDINGIVEPIRYILHYGNEKFEDIRYDYKEWPIQSVKESLPYGQLPLYQEGDKSLNQSLAIARYVGQKANLVPADPWEQAVLDAAVLNIYDYWSKGALCLHEKDAKKKEELIKVFVNETIDFYFSRFEKDLQSKNGHFGKKLSWADFILVGIVETTNLLFNLNVDDKYPTVLALRNKIRTLPGVKEYIASKKPYVFSPPS